LRVKLCRKCNTEKPLDKFYINRTKGDGHSALCKKCCGRATQNWIKNNPEKYRASLKNRQTKYILAWKNLITRLYGKKPICQICDTKKRWPWEKGSWKDTICFDHKKLNLAIECTPSAWLRRRLPSPKNVEIFKSCKFGLLCRDCNFRLPTKKRLIWARKLLKYCESGGRL